MAFRSFQDANRVELRTRWTMQTARSPWATPIRWPRAARPDRRCTQTARPRRRGWPARCGSGAFEAAAAMTSGALGQSARKQIAGDAGEARRRPRDPLRRWRGTPGKIHEGVATRHVPSRTSSTLVESTPKKFRHDASSLDCRCTACNCPSVSITVIALDVIFGVVAIPSV